MSSPDYTSLGLDSQLQATDGLMAKDDKQVSGYDFRGNNDRSAVTAYNIGNFNFNSGTGGTITLGGTNNGNGQLIVRASSGGTICTINNNGIVVNNGSITIQNSAGSAVIDSDGLNSANNFEYGQAQGGSNETYSGTTFTDISGATLTTTNFSRTKNVLVFMRLIGWIDRIGAGAYSASFTVRFNIDGTEYSTSSFSSSDTTNQDNRETISNFQFYSLGTGTHVIKLTARVDPGADNALGVDNGFRLGYVVLGN